jgi:molecular chaperone GrpE
MMNDKAEKNTAAKNYREDSPASKTTQEEVIWEEKYLRLRADLENTKKRLERTSAQEIERQRESLLFDILPIADGLDLALQHISPAEDNRNMVQGIEMNRTLLQTFLKKYKVEEIKPLGHPFDPNQHESIGMLRYPGVAPNTVVRVEQKGYRHNGKLLRPAKVFIAAR